VFLGWHFLFTYSDTSAVGCIVLPQHMAKNRTAEISKSGIAMTAWSGHVTMAIPDMAFVAVQFCRYILLDMQYNRHS